MGEIKINNEIYGTSNSSNIIYKDITVEEKLDTIPVFDINDNGNVENNNTDYLTYANILDNLNSTNTDKALSANQGKILNEKINTTNEAVDNNFNILSEVFETFKSSFLNLVYPIGAVYISINSTSPATLFGGTWEAIKDRFLLSAGSSYSAGSTGGAATVTLKVNEIPVHEGHLTDNNTNTGGNYAGYLANTTTTAYGSSGRGWNVQMGNEIVPAGHNKGGGAAHNNMPPYLTVYMWKRVS